MHFKSVLPLRLQILLQKLWRHISSLPLPTCPVSSMWSALVSLFSVWWHGGGGVRVTLEVGSAWVKTIKNVGLPAIASLFLAYGGHVALRDTGLSPLYIQDHFSVGVTLEVRLHRFTAGVNWSGEARKNPRVRSARRGIRKWWCWAPGTAENGQKKIWKGLP